MTEEDGILGIQDALPCEQDPIAVYKTKHKTLRLSSWERRSSRNETRSSAQLSQE